MSSEPKPEPAETKPAAAAPEAASATPAAANGTAVPAAAAKAAKPLPAMLPMILVVVGALAAGGALGAILVGPRMVAARSTSGAEAPEKPGEHAKEEKGKGGHGKEEKKKGGHGEKEKGGKAVLYKIENLIVNPAGTNGTRFLMAGIAFELSDDKEEETMREREVEIRDVVISTLERQTLETLTRPGARDSLKAELLRAIVPVVDGIEVSKVYLPQFVLQ